MLRRSMTGSVFAALALAMALTAPTASGSAAIITYKAKGTDDPKAKVLFDIIIKQTREEAFARVQDIEARNVFFRCNGGITQRGHWPFVQQEIPLGDDGDFRGKYSAGTVREVLSGRTVKADTEDLAGSKKLKRLPRIKGLMVLETGSGCKSGRVPWKAKPIDIAGGGAD